MSGSSLRSLLTHRFGWRGARFVLDERTAICYTYVRKHKSRARLTRGQGGKNIMGYMIVSTAAMVIATVIVLVQAYREFKKS